MGFPKVLHGLYLTLGVLLTKRGKLIQALGKCTLFSGEFSETRLQRRRKWNLPFFFS